MKFRVRVEGSSQQYVRVRVFVCSHEGDTYAYAGSLSFRHYEWDAFRDILGDDVEVINEGNGSDE